ncbi:MAG: rane protein [Gemmatimonadetes bacterium]|nr:rane protein [Gemmatimonadota bacterium]
MRKLREIFRFELAYQIRRVSTWLYFAVLAIIAYNSIRGNYVSDARNGDFFLNSPFVVAAVTVLCSLLWLLVAAAVAGDAATRDVQTPMHPLTYTTPVSKAEYLGGRFIAAFVVNALILLAVPAGILLALYSPGVEAEILGPFRPAAYLGAYGFIALPNALIATAIQFSLAALNRRGVASYLGSVLLFVSAYIVAGGVAVLVQRELGKLLDPIGVVTVLTELSSVWTPIEKHTRLIRLEGTLLWNRVLWVSIALGMLAFTHRRFRFGHPAASTRWRRGARRRDVHSPALAAKEITRGAPISIPQVPRTFGVATHVRQTLAIAWTSFRMIAKSRGGLVPLAVIAVLAGLYMLGHMEFMSVPLLPRTEYLITFLTAPLTDARSPWIIIPLLTVFYAGELVWREREAGLSEMADAAPVPEWVIFAGKFLGLSLVLAAWLALLTAAGMLAQVRLGYHDFEIALYLKVLGGLQLADYLLFALLALVVHVVVNQKHVGQLVALVAYGFIGFASALGIEHNLLVYTADPGWSYGDMSRFGPSLAPWLWTKLYWTAWALLLAVVGKLLWVRGRERDVGVRIRMARRRFTRPAAGAAAAALALILILGGFIFYNTNVLNEYHSASDTIERRAEYERRYGRYESVPQPWLTGTSLHVEIFPERRAADVRGTYRLVNNSAAAIDSIHLATASAVRTGAVTFDRPASGVLVDDDLGHRIYALEKPLQPGDSLQLDFEVHFEPRGFRNGGADASVVANGTHFTNQEWLPAIGYQPSRALSDAGSRRARGLAPRPAAPSLYDVEARGHRTDAEWTTVDVVVGTDGNQTAVAPGSLRRTWTDGGRRYFHYVTDAPIRNEYALVSASYALHEAQWNGVTIQIFHHPGHAANVERMVRSVRAALSYCTRQFGPYPYRHIRLIERPSGGFGLHADAANITYEEGFSRLNPEDSTRGLDLVFSVVAHEVAHQWWGAQLWGAHVEGALLLSETLAQYTAMQVVKEAYGDEHLGRLLDEMRAAYEVPRTRAGVPLLRATDGFLAYRKGPFALYTVSRYVGEDRVNTALRYLLEKHGPGVRPLATSLDLYQELQAVTPDSLQYLLHDLFEANTFWELETERATAVRTAAGTWQVTLDVRARKVVVDSAGVETAVPMDDWVEVGVFASAEKGGKSGKPLHVQKQRIRSGKQTIMVMVSGMPARAGLDPNHLLVDLKIDDNEKQVKALVVRP